MKIRLVLLLFSLSIAIFNTTEGSYRSIDDCIVRETESIHQAEMQGASDLSTCYITRAESYIVSGKIEQALDDLRKGNEIAYQLHQNQIEQRSLIDMMVAYAYLGEDEKALSAMEHFVNLFYSPDVRTPRKFRSCKDEQYIEGPDQTPYPGWCREAVENSVETLFRIVNLSKLNPLTKETILFSIEQVKKLALQCCARGGLWKGCVGPLAKKLVEWKAFGVPANPAWD